MSYLPLADARVVATPAATMRTYASPSTAVPAPLAVWRTEVPSGTAGPLHVVDVDQVVVVVAGQLHARSPDASSSSRPVTAHCCPPASSDGSPPAPGTWSPSPRHSPERRPASAPETPSPCRGPGNRQPGCPSLGCSVGSWDGRRALGPAPVDGRDCRPGVIARGPRPSRPPEPSAGARVRPACRLDGRGHGVPPRPAARDEQAGGGQAPADAGGRGLRRGALGRGRRTAEAGDPHPARPGRGRASVAIQRDIEERWMGVVGTQRMQTLRSTLRQAVLAESDGTLPPVRPAW